jgi:hypothetical protein
VQGYKNEGLSSQHDCDPLLGSRKPLRRISEDGRRRENIHRREIQTEPTTQ